MTGSLGRVPYGDPTGASAHLTRQEVVLKLASLDRLREALTTRP
jgi:hypothetical protein